MSSSPEPLLSTVAPPADLRSAHSVLSAPPSSAPCSMYRRRHRSLRLCVDRARASSAAAVLYLAAPCAPCAP